MPSKIWNYIINRLIIIGVILFILIGIFIIIYLKKEGFSCALNPIRFYELKTNASCYCSDQISKIIS
jgi:hypothetical protein